MKGMPENKCPSGGNSTHTHKMCTVLEFQHILDLISMWLNHNLTETCTSDPPLKVLTYPISYSTAKKFDSFLLIYVHHEQTFPALQVFNSNKNKHTRATTNPATYRSLFKMRIKKIQTLQPNYAHWIMISFRVYHMFSTRNLMYNLFFTDQKDFKHLNHDKGLFHLTWNHSYVHSGS